MKIRISQVKHKNMDALLMESDSLALTILPESGAKIQSLYHKGNQKEFLYQSNREEFRKAAYGTKFSNGDFSGFDEIFPTIDECFYPSAPWVGTPVPDHGEVWVLPWDYQVAENSITLSVHGVRFPYRIEKKIEFLRDNCFRLSYQVFNLSDFDFNFIWVPHPLFVCDEDSKVVLPPSVKKIVSSCPLENMLGDFGSVHAWPITETPTGEAYDISDVAHPPYADKCEKFYAVNKPLEGWCALQNKRSGETIGLSYPVDKLPYLGVWEGIIQDQFLTALEPAAGSLDRLDEAKYASKAGLLKAKSKNEWFLNLTIETVGQINDIDQDGYIR